MQLVCCRTQGTVQWNQHTLQELYGQPTQEGGEGPALHPAVHAAETPSMPGRVLLARHPPATRMQSEMIVTKSQGVQVAVAASSCATATAA